MLMVCWQVKEIMQKAFWDLLEQQLEAEPPQYTQVRSVFHPAHSGGVSFSSLLVEYYFLLFWWNIIFFSGTHSSH